MVNSTHVYKLREAEQMIWWDHEFWDAIPDVVCSAELQTRGTLVIDDKTEVRTGLNCWDVTCTAAAWMREVNIAAVA